MKKILVPIDFSKYSEYALKVAAKLASKQETEIIVYHMLGLSEAILTKNDDQETEEAMYYLQLAKKRFADFLDKEYVKDIKLTELVQSYKNFGKINEIVQEYEIDLIVMGSQGTSGFQEEIFIGSNAEKVVRTSKTPVLIIKQEPKDFKMNHVVFVSDFKIENVSVYQKAMRFFKNFGTKVDLLYVNLPGTEFKNSVQMENRVREFLFKADKGNLEAHNNIHYYSDYSVEGGVFRYSEQADVDLIAIPTHGRKGLSHFFNGSIGEDIVNHSDRPVITFKI